MTIKLKPLNEQVILITGASSGIGLVTARAAAKAGAKVLLVARSEDTLRQVTEEITAGGGTAAFSVADVGDAEALKRAATHAVQRFGRIDTWVSDAGVAIYAKLLDTPLDEHEQLFRTNYFGVVNSAAAAIPQLRQHGGAFIVVGSIASDIPSPIMGAYAASKHAAKAYVEGLRIELRERPGNISITLVKPSGIDTPIGQHAANHAAAGEAQIPPPVYAPELVADAILHAAVHPQRDITVGGAGRAQVLFGQHFPRLLELLAPKSGKALVDSDKPQLQPSNLFKGVRAGAERSGEHAPKEFSLYTAAAKHPRTTAALSVGALIGGASLLLFNNRRQR